MQKRNEGLYEEGSCTGTGCKKEFTLKSWNQEFDTKVYAQKYLKSKLANLEQELNKKSELQEKFSKEIDDLNQETEDLVEEIDKWQI